MAKNGPKQSQRGPNAPKMTPNLGQRFHYVRSPYNHVFEPPTPGWRRLAARLLLNMAKMGPRRLKWAQKGPKTAQSGPECPQNDPTPRTKVPLCTATLSPCVWAPDSRAAPVGGHVTAENGRNGPRRGQKQPQMGPCAPKMAPNLGQRFHDVRPSHHHVFGPQTLKCGTARRLF